jgi:membrane-bound lytic murein transglycosylase B
MKKGIKRALIFILLFLIGYLILSASIQERKNQLMGYLRGQGVPREYIQSVFKDKRLALVFPKTAKEAEYFNDKLMGPDSVARGVKFWEEHRLELERAVLAHPKLKQEYLISILRIESDLGRNGGHAPAINYLYTWVVRNNASQDKRDFAKWQIYHLLRISLKYGWDIFTIRGSYMGAFGYCQFLPENYEKFGEDGNGDGVIDLFNWDDAIMSIANYLEKFDFEYSYQGIRESLWKYNKGPYRYAVMLYAYLITLP